MKRLPSILRHRGFSMVEMIITVAVLAILVSISSPSIYQFLRQKDDQEEETKLHEIQKAMQAYLADKGELPEDGGQAVGDEWYTKLAGYSRLSAQEIISDTWGRPRQYVKLKVARRIYNQNLDVTYATVHSMGVNGTAEDTYVDSTGGTSRINGLCVASGRFPMPGTGACAGASQWWREAAAANQIKYFSGMRPGGDDHMTRFTNYTEIMDNYKLTMTRLDKISQALEIYARSGYAKRVSKCTSSPSDIDCQNSIPEKTIYYPCATPRTGADQGSQCGSQSGTRQHLFAETAEVVDNSDSDGDRMTQMINLMQKLGLPAEYCCSALEVFRSGTDVLPMPFFYYPNPRERGCNSADNHPLTDDTKYPARLTTSRDPDVCG